MSPYLQYLQQFAPAYLPGYITRDVSQIQAALSTSVGPILGAAGGYLITEFGLTRVHDMPSSDIGLQSGSADPSGGATATSYGYVMLLRLNYIRAIGGVGLTPHVQLRHGLDGHAPLPFYGGFVEDSLTLTLGISARYQNRWEATLDYEIQAGGTNSSRNRDSVAVTMKYTF